MQLPLFLEKNAQIVMGLGMIRIELKSLLETEDRLSRFIGVAQEISQVVVDFRRFRAQAHGPVEKSFSFFKASGFLEDNGQRRNGFDQIRIDLEGPAQSLFGLLRLPQAR